MLQKGYQLLITEILRKNFPLEAKIFVFGSSLTSDTFRDVDIGVKNAKITHKTLVKAKDALEESRLPYKVDIIDFEKVDHSFRKNVFENQVLWLT